MDTNGCGHLVFSAFAAIVMSIVSISFLSVTIPPAENLHMQGYGTLAAMVFFLPSSIFYLLSSGAISILTTLKHENPQFTRLYQFIIALIILLPFTLVLFDAYLWLAALIAVVMLFILALVLDAMAWHS